MSAVSLPPDPGQGAGLPRAIYRAEGMKIWKAPVRCRRPDGSTAITIGFWACTATPTVGEAGATTIAAMLCAAEHHEALLAALQGMVALCEASLSLDSDVVQAALAAARQAMAEAAPSASRDEGGQS